MRSIFRLSIVTAFILNLLSVSVAAAPQDQSIVLAGGCFWGMEAVFEHVKGVDQVVSGYAGGDASTAHYDMVSTGQTGHAESVKIMYDPKTVSLEQLLDIYFIAAHNPTELNYQYPDHGPQYRSTVFFADQDQEHTAKVVIEQLNDRHSFDAPIVTTIEHLKQFYPAEEYHQHYAALHPDNSYIVTYDLPRVERVKKDFPEFYVDRKI